MSRVKRLIPSLPVRLTDEDAERSRAHVEKRIDELQALPAIGLRVLATNLELPNATEVAVRHGLGRAPLFVFVSPPRGPGAAGVIEEVRDTYASGQPIDRTQFIVLMASSFTSTVVVDVAVM